MEHQQQQHPNNSGGTPPPLGAIYESPPNLLERLRELNEHDPAFVSWVLLRAEELAELVSELGAGDAPNVKEHITQSLIEAYDIHTALIAREEIMTMLLN